MNTRPIAAGLFDEGASPRLRGGRHRQTGRFVFPCPQGGERDSYDEVRLASTGTLWSWTIQRFRPKSPPYTGPEAFEPFALGYVALAGQTIVEARLTGMAFDAIRIGMALRLTTLPFATDPDGTTVLIYAFEPDGDRAS